MSLGAREFIRGIERFPFYMGVFYEVTTIRNETIGSSYNAIVGVRDGLCGN